MIDTAKFFIDKNYEIFRNWVDSIVKLIVEYRINNFRKEEIK